MSLVQYSSSSDESDGEEEVVSNVIVEESKPKESGTSISSFLPPPKHRHVPKREPRVLGKAIRKIAGEAEDNPDNIVLEKSTRKVTSFIPSSLRNKKQTASAVVKSEEKEKPEAKVIPKIELFQTIKTRPKVIPSYSSSKIEVKPITDKEGEEIQGGTQLDPIETQANSKKRSAEGEIPDESSIKEFNVNNFYQENLTLKDQGLLQENKKLHTITHSKNQLSALLKNAQQDGDLLHEHIEHNKRMKKERGDKYGW